MSRATPELLSTSQKAPMVLVLVVVVAQSDAPLPRARDPKVHAGNQETKAWLGLSVGCMVVVVVVKSMAVSE